MQCWSKKILARYNQITFKVIKARYLTIMCRYRDSRFQKSDLSEIASEISDNASTNSRTSRDEKFDLDLYSTKAFWC